METPIKPAAREGPAQTRLCVCVRVNKNLYGLLFCAQVLCHRGFNLIPQIIVPVTKAEKRQLITNTQPTRTPKPSPSKSHLDLDQSSEAERTNHFEYEEHPPHTHRQSFIRSVPV